MMMPEAPPDAPLESTTFTTAMTHLYRGEMNRLTVWRQRLEDWAAHYHRVRGRRASA
jgi:uncharacterized membrane protein